MGCVCCCLRGNNEEDEQNPETPPAFGLPLSQQIYHMLFQRRQLHGASSSVQRVTPSGCIAEDSLTPDTYHPPPMPLPYDDPRFSRSHCESERLISRHDKISTHFLQDNEALQATNFHEGGAKMNGSGRSKPHLSHFCPKLLCKGATDGTKCTYSSSEDEDCCPTCLEEYTSENPRITIQCSHHFHLACIYEWMERSEACPICGKVMLFEEPN